MDEQLDKSHNPTCLLSEIAQNIGQRNGD